MMIVAAVVFGFDRPVREEIVLVLILVLVVIGTPGEFRQDRLDVPDPAAVTVLLVDQLRLVKVGEGIHSKKCRYATTTVTSNPNPSTHLSWAPPSRSQQSLASSHQKERKGSLGCSPWF